MDLTGRTATVTSWRDQDKHYEWRRMTAGYEQTQGQEAGLEKLMLIPLMITARHAHEW